MAKKTIKEKLSWNLDEILKAKDFEKLYKEIEKEMGQIEGWVKKLKPEMKEETFRGIMDFEEELGKKITRLEYMPYLWEQVDQKNQEAKKLKGRADDLGVRLAQKSRVISHWLIGKEMEGLKRLDDKNAKRLFATIPDLEYGLNYDRTAAKYTLKKDEEDIISHKDVNGANQLINLREIIETEFEFDLKIKGKKTKKIRTLSELLSLVHSPKKTERKAAHRAMLFKYWQNIDKFFLVYSAIVKDWDYEAKLRGYKSPISVRNFGNHVPDEAVETLLKVCRDNREIFQNYFKYKAKRLGMKKLERWDIYAPLEKKTKKINFGEAKELVLETFENFLPKFAKLAKRIFEDQHIDSHPSSVKRSGAFCATVMPEISPYIMLNHDNQMRDVFTMAHELGHGIHSLYAAHHRMGSQHANLPLSETASTFGEMVLFERIFSAEQNIDIKRSMLSEKMADSFASILRQNYFVIFEKRAHEAIQKGITAEELSEMWLSTLKEQFGNSVKIDKIFKYEWCVIPHIVNSPFYCYAYNFGELLSFALFARYKKEGKSFIAKIEKILAAGGSEDPDKILKKVGVDMRSEKFWQGSFEIIKEWQKELENLG